MTWSFVFENLNCWWSKIQVFLKNDYRNLPLRLLFFFSHFWVLRVGSQNFCLALGQACSLAQHGVKVFLPSCLTLCIPFTRFHLWKIPSHSLQRLLGTGKGCSLVVSEVHEPLPGRHITSNPKTRSPEEQMGWHSLVMSARWSPQYTPNSKLLLF